MQFGVYCQPTWDAGRDGPPGPFLRRLVEFLASAEGLGFDAAWVGERHFHPSGGMAPAPAVVLAALAQRTSHLRLGAVVVLSLRHPVEIAEQLAMVDLLSGGRLDFGAGTGHTPYEHEVFEVSFTERHDRAREALEVILKAWRGSPFDHEGPYHGFANVEVWPRPQQEPHPPVWIPWPDGPLHPAEAARGGHHLLATLLLSPLEEAVVAGRAHREAWIASGRDPAMTRLGCLCPVVVAEDGRGARRAAQEALRSYLELRLAGFAGDPKNPAAVRLQREIIQFSGERWIDEGRLVAGTPFDCVALLRRFQRELGLRTFIGMFQVGGMSLDEAERSAALFAQEVMPRLR
jgi:alkanesulfonate monooxygenase SsuD/methylene tetrahydromethanopterin reductase-like flavin-dependent oxidoreductase (luciferase family)